MESGWLLAALFLPLFPFSFIFVFVLRKVPDARLQSLLFLLWPLPGLFVLAEYPAPFQTVLPFWALATALLYALRMLVVRELSLWLGYLAVSVWALLWIVLPVVGSDNPLIFMSSLSLPLAIMALLGGEIKKRFQSAYAGVSNGLAQSHPALAGLFVVVVLALSATPLFPGFFIMLSTIIQQFTSAPYIAVGMLLVWLFWSWAAMRMVQGIVMGVAVNNALVTKDLNAPSVLFYGGLLAGLVWLGVNLAGVVL